MPTADIQEELTKSDILELTNEENVYSGYPGGVRNSDILVLKNEENVYSVQVSWSSQMKKMSKLDIHEALANSGILELTNEENVCSGYLGGAYQLEKKKFKDILELTNATRNGPLLFSSLSGCK